MADKKILMSDVFELPFKVNPKDGLVATIGDLYGGWLIGFTDTPFKYLHHAVNNHDKLVERVELLEKRLKGIGIICSAELDESVKTTRSYQKLMNHIKEIALSPDLDRKDK